MRRTLAATLGAALAAAALAPRPARAQQPAADRPWGWAVMTENGVGPFFEWMGVPYMLAVPVRDTPGGPYHFVGFDGQPSRDFGAQLDGRLLAVASMNANRRTVLARDERGWKLMDGATGRVREALPALGGAAPKIHALDGRHFLFVVGDDEVVVNDDGDVVLPATRGAVYGGKIGADNAFEYLVLLPQPGGASLDVYSLDEKRVVVRGWPTKPGDADARRYVAGSNLLPRWSAAAGRFGFQTLRGDSMWVSPTYVDVRPFSDDRALVFDSAGGRLRAQLIDLNGKTHATFADARPCGSGSVMGRLFVCLADRVALVDTAGTEIARFDRDYEFDPYLPTFGGWLFWLHRTGADGRVQWLGVTKDGARAIDGPAAARISDVRPGYDYGTYVVRGWASASGPVAAAEQAARLAAARDSAAALVRARLHAGHGLQPLSREDARAAEADGGFYQYRLIRLYANRHIVGAPSASDYAMSVVTVWAEKKHGQQPAAELAAQAGCPVGDDQWALAYSGIYVVENVNKDMKDMKKLYKSVLGSEYVQGYRPCRTELFKETF